jgi:hypothetical protein
MFVAADELTTATIATSAEPGSAKSLKHLLHEVVEGLLPFWAVVRAVCDVPDVWNFFLLEIRVRPLADANQPVLVAAREPKEFQFFDRLGVGDKLGRTLGIWRGGESADIGKGVEV